MRVIEGRQSPHLELHDGAIGDQAGHCLHPAEHAHLDDQEQKRHLLELGIPT
jgi:hypothetical protein